MFRQGKYLCHVDAINPGIVIPRRIFVGGIPYGCTPNELQQFFSSFGFVTDSRIMVGEKGISKGYEKEHCRFILSSSVSFLQLEFWSISIVFGGLYVTCHNYFCFVQ